MYYNKYVGNSMILLYAPSETYIFLISNINKIRLQLLESLTILEPEIRQPSYIFRIMQLTTQANKQTFQNYRKCWQLKSLFTQFWMFRT